MRHRWTPFLAGAAAAALLAAAGCSSHAVTQYTHPNADLGALKSVAVLPFENLSADRTSADKVQKIFLSELLATSAFNVVEPGLVSKTLKADRVETTESLGPADFKRLGEELKADAVFTGAVVDFAENRTGSGASASARLFGIGGASLTETARNLVKEELHTLVR